MVSSGLRASLVRLVSFALLVSVFLRIGALWGGWLWLVRKKKKGGFLALSFLLLLLDLDVLAEPGETFEDAWSNWSAPLLLACVVFFF